jgi:PAS domain S-box-containing protein
VRRGRKPDDVPDSRPASGSGQETAEKPAEPGRPEQDRFRTAFAHAAAGIASTTVEGRFLLVNRALCRITGYTEAELLATDFLAITHAADVPDQLAAMRRMQDCNTSGFAIEKRYVTKSGDEVWVQDSVSVVRDAAGNAESLVILVADISDRKRGEQALGESELRFRAVFDALRLEEERLRLAVEGAALGTWHWSLPDGELIWSSRCYEICGVPLGSPVTLDLFIGLLHPDDREAVEAAIRDALAGTPYDVEFRIRWRDGSVRWLASVGRAYHDADGKAVRMEGVVRDVTERRLAAEALQRAKTFAEDIIETANVMFLHLDSAGIVRKLNSAAETITGYKRAEVEGTSWFEALVPRDRYPYAWDEFERLMKEGAAGSSFENPILTKRGEERQILWRNTTLREGGRIVGNISFGMDVTDLSAARKRLKALSRRLLNLQEKERSAIARELHDEVGQLLTGLKMMLEAQALRFGVDLAGTTELLGQLLERVSDLSLNLRPPMLDDCGLVPTLLWHFERYRTQTGVEVRFHHRGLDARLAPETEIGTFRIIQEALTNVARHAGVREATVELCVEESSVLVRVEDRGRGFDPRAVGTGSSGLAGMQERARLVSGSLTVDTRPGAGTRLEARFPLSIAMAADPDHDGAERRATLLAD